MAEIAERSRIVCVFHFIGGRHFVYFGIFFADCAGVDIGFRAGIYDLQRYKAKVLAK